MIYLLIFLSVFSAFFIALVAGYLTGLYLFCKIESENDDAEWLFKAHCFQCEIEMPVKEKNGRLYCSNCGLYH